MSQFDNDPVARRDASHAIADFRYFAGGFHARRERQFGFELIFAGRHQNIGKIDTGRMNGDSHLPVAQRRRGKIFQMQALRRTEFAADDRFWHQAALAVRRCSASRISGIRSLPKYISVLSIKIVGEPKPPRAITSSVLALSWSLMACSPIPAKSLAGSIPSPLQISLSTTSCEMSLSPPQ